MIVEFVGCTGAGKSTLVKHVMNDLALQGLEISDAEKVVLPWFPERSRHSLPGIFALHAISIFAVLKRIRPYWNFCVFSWKMLRKYETSPRIFINFYRNVIKRIGIYELIGRYMDSEEVIFFDEGTVQTAHSLFIHLGVDPDLEDVLQFSNLVPLPNLIVYVTAPMPVIQRRTMDRPRRSLIIADQDRQVIEAYLARAAVMYGFLATTSSIRERLVTIEGELQDSEALGAAAERIKTSILDWRKLHGFRDKSSILSERKF